MLNRSIWLAKPFIVHENEVCDYTALLQANIRRIDPRGWHFVEIFCSMALAAVAFAAWQTYRRSEETYVPGDRWRLIVLSHLVQVVAGSIWAMGAWQDQLRDDLRISDTSTTMLMAAAFISNVIGFVGGVLFDKLGPGYPACIGGLGMTLGYCLLGVAVSANISCKFQLALVGYVLLGFCSENLLDNTVCMACSVSFPRNRAALVGYLKAVLSMAGGLWALLWVQIFQRLGLRTFLAVQALTAFVVGVSSPSNIKVLPKELRHRLQGDEYPYAALHMSSLLLLICLNILSSYWFSTNAVAMPAVGVLGAALALAPLLVLIAQKGTVSEASDASPASKADGKEGLPFCLAVRGLDFYLLWFVQFCITGAAFALNQNLALILESAGHQRYNASTGFGVALFAFSSTLSRVGAGILSDKYRAFTKLNWVMVAAGCTAVGQFLVSLMTLEGIMLGALLTGLSFGIFFSIIVPLVNEMYGQLEYGMIWGVQVSSQAATAAIIMCGIMPFFYRKAAAGQDGFCVGPDCYRTSFLVISGLNACGLISSVALQVRNSGSTPAKRMGAVTERLQFST